jgi:hypothetical protein
MRKILKKNSRMLFRGLTICLFACPIFASTVDVTSSSLFVGLLDTWNFAYVSGAPGVDLQQITIDLSPTNVRFNTAPGGFGANEGFQDVGNFFGTNATTGLLPTYSHGAALDGGSLLTFTFTNFTAGDNFTFSADVDHPDPTLVSTSTCNGLPPISKAICVGIVAAENAAEIASAETVLNAELAHADVTFQFGGPGYLTSTMTEPLNVAEDGIVQPVSTPEPATLAMGLAGVALLAGFRWKSRR